MRPSARILAPLLAPLLLLVAAPASADWPDDPTVNVPVCLAVGDKSDVFGVSDGAGGAIVVWEDSRGGDGDIYAQRISADGEMRWQVDGIAVCTAAGDQDVYHSSTGTTGFTPVIADGAGGAWIVWQDERDFSTRLRDIYARHVDAEGRLTPVSGGVRVAGGAGMEDRPTACSDGRGGVIIAWQDKNADPVFFDIWGQRLDADGTPLWNGGQPLPLVVVGWDQDGPSLCADGQGGAFLAWSDSRDDVGDVYAQRLAADGTALWSAPSGVDVCAQPGGQDAITARLASDGDLLLAWVDRRSGSPDIYAQKVAAADGDHRWLVWGYGVGAAPGSQYRPALASDGEGGAIVAWFDYRNAPSGPPWNLDIFAQRMTSGGEPAWVDGGVSVCGAPDAQRDVDLVADGRGGVVLAWEDNRGGDGLEDIYAQHLRADGIATWATDGVPVSTAPNNQKRPDLVAGADGAIILWPDDRESLYEADVYADRVQVFDPTAAPDGAGSVDLALCVQRDAGVLFSLPRGAPVWIDVHDLRGRRVATLADGRWYDAGEHRLVWPRTGASGRPLPSGLYLVRLRTGSARATASVTIVR